MSNQEKVFVFTLTASEAELIGKALGELPFKQVVSLVSKLQSTINTQLAQANQEGNKGDAGLPT